MRFMPTICLSLTVWMTGCGSDDDSSAARETPGADAGTTPGADAGVVPQSVTCDPSSGDTYYVSPTGSDTGAGSSDDPWASLARGAAALAPGDTLYLREGVYQEPLVITTSGTAQAPILIASDPMGGKAEVNGQGVSLDEDGLISILGASHIKLCSLTVRSSPNHGVSVQDSDEARPEHVAVVGVSVFDSGNAGIYVEDADDVVIENNTTRETVTSGIGVWYSNNVAVRDNEIVNARNDDEKGHEEWISIAGVCDFEVASNELYMDHPDFEGHSGIDAKESSCRGSIHHNYIHDFPGYGGQIYLDAWEAGLDGTGTLNNIDVYANRLETAGGITVGSEQGGTVEHIRIFNNILHNPWSSGIAVSDHNAGNGGDGPKRDIHIYNNTIWGSRNHGTSAIYLLSSNIESVVVQNNIIVMDPQRVVGLITAGSQAVLAGLTVDHNLVFGPTECSNDYPDCVEVSGWEGNTTADPLVVDGPGGDVHLQANSPAIDQGVSIQGLTSDFEGTARPQGQGIDIGALERP